MIKEIDHDGLTLCSIQGRLFEESKEKTNTSSSIFIRRFMNSNVAKSFDSKDFLNDTKSTTDIFNDLDNEFGQSSYGSVKFNAEALFWMGYIYRYFAYTYNLTSKQIYKIVKPDELNKLYYPYHTMDCSNAIERILEEKNISFDIEKQNEKLLKLIRKNAYENNVSLIPMTNELAHSLFLNKKDNMSSYTEDKKSQGYTLLAIVYKEKAIGEISFSGFKYDSSELSIQILNDKYKNKGIGTIAIIKAIQYAKDTLKLETIRAIIKEDNEIATHIFKKLGFELVNNDFEYLYFRKKIQTDKNNYKLSIDEATKRGVDILKRIRLQEKLIKMIGSYVTVYIDRPIGYNHKGITYTQNYGYIKDFKALDGAYQDAYVIGEAKPLKEFSGRVVAVIKRLDDIEDKLVVSKGDKEYTNQEIEEYVEFVEKHFKHEIIR